MPLSPLIEPIPGSDPGGIDLTFLSEFDAIQEARRADDPSLDQGEWERELKLADWPGVARLCHIALCDRTKDLRIAGWYLEARTQVDGLPGLAEGLGVLASLCEGLWPDLHPRGDDDEERLGCLRWAVGLSVRWIPTAPKGERYETLAAVQASLAAVDRLGAAIEKHVPGEGPSLTAVREALRDVLAALQLPSSRHPDPLSSAVPDVLRVTSIAGASPGTRETSTASDRPYREAPPLPFSHRSEALDRLRDVARFFRETEPHSPVAYLADKAARWGDLPLHEWLQQVLGEGDALGRMRDLLDIGDDRGAE